MAAETAVVVAAAETAVVVAAAETAVVVAAAEAAETDQTISPPVARGDLITHPFQNVNGAAVVV